jgi:hypothetical protein
MTKTSLYRKAASEVRIDTQAASFVEDAGHRRLPSVSWIDSNLSDRRRPRYP